MRWLRNLHANGDVLNAFQRTDTGFNVGANLFWNAGICGGDVDANQGDAIIEFNLSDQAEGDDVTAESREFDCFESCFNVFGVHGTVAQIKLLSL